MALLATPVEQFVQDANRLHGMLEPIAGRLPVDLQRTLYRAADLHLYQGEVTAATARIATRQGEAALRQKIVEESLTL